MSKQPSIAVLIPCQNKALTLAEVVRGFAAALPHAAIYVYVNNSTDATAEAARAAGAEVRAEQRPGKGSIVRRRFADIEADWYLMVDGDATYEATAAPRLLQHAIANHLEMVNAERGRRAARRTGAATASAIACSRDWWAASSANRRATC